MPSSESGISENSVGKSQIKSYVTVKKGDQIDNYKSDGELDDDSDDQYEDEGRKSERREKYDKRSDDDDRREKERRRRYSSDDERYDKYESSYYRKDAKRDYSDHSDNEATRSKRRRKYSSDEADASYDDNRNVHRSRQRDQDEYYADSREQRGKDRYKDRRNDRKQYFDLDKPRSDEEDHYRKSDKRKKEKYDREKRRGEKKSANAIRAEKSIDDASGEVSKENAPPSPKKAKVEDIFSKAGGAYIPPSKLRQMQAGITDKNSVAYQRMAWEALKKSVVGLINKVNASNMDFIVKELLEENIVRGRGLFAQSVIRAQVASPTFTNVYACLAAIINTRFPNIGELILRRLIIQFRKSFQRNDKPVCINSAKFIAHLVNQQVAHELLALEILTLLLHNHTGDSVEVAVSFLKDVGQKLIEVSPKGINAVFERLRNILHDSATEKRIQYMIEVIFHIRRDNFQSFPSIVEGLDQIEEDEQITHLLRLDDAGTTEDILNVFKHDPNYVENEEKYKQIKCEIIGSDDSSSDEDGDDEDDDDSGDEEEGKEEEKMTVVDMTETNLVELRRLIYLTIQSSLDFEECAHKMMKFDLKDGQQHEFCVMVVECCAQQRSYEKFYGLLAQRFCLLRKEFMEQFMIIFQEQYDSCHHLDTGKLRNTAKLFSHLLVSNAIPWTVMQTIKLTEADTTSSSRIFIKILFQELAEYLGIPKLLTRLKDPTIEMCLEGVFPRDNPNDTRFAINFFTAIGLGVLTDDLREHLKTMPKVSTISDKFKAAALLSSSSSSSSSSSDSSGSDSSDSNSSSSSSESDGNDKKSKNKSRKKKSRSKSPKKKESNERSSNKKKTSKKSNESLSSREERSSSKQKDRKSRRGSRDR